MTAQRGTRPTIDIELACGDVLYDVPIFSPYHLGSEGEVTDPGTEGCPFHSSRTTRWEKIVEIRFHEPVKNRKQA